MSIKAKQIITGMRTSRTIVNILTNAVDISGKGVNISHIIYVMRRLYFGPLWMKLQIVEYTA